ncbi:hypothetical protein G7Y89_g10087 [Cudoniella acicularis]|uniref:Uncharacterized protein n=1 Tax=Cudoniella acicularis TaxID=354080 RepID=A0A8H4RF01_9HELO|nr:hypothetical protein G7Y89_g10087 [Cudoniella acicularis]
MQRQVGALRERQAPAQRRRRWSRDERPETREDEGRKIAWASFVRCLAQIESFLPHPGERRRNLRWEFPKKRVDGAAERCTKVVDVDVDVDGGVCERAMMGVDDVAVGVGVGAGVAVVSCGGAPIDVGGLFGLTGPALVLVLVRPSRVATLSLCASSPGLSSSNFSSSTSPGPLRALYGVLHGSCSRTTRLRLRAIPQRAVTGPLTARIYRPLSATGPPSTPQSKPYGDGLDGDKEGPNSPGDLNIRRNRSKDSKHALLCCLTIPTLAWATEGAVNSPECGKVNHVNNSFNMLQIAVLLSDYRLPGQPRTRTQVRLQIDDGSQPQIAHPEEAIVICLKDDTHTMLSSEVGDEITKDRTNYRIRVSDFKLQHLPNVISEPNRCLIEMHPITFMLLLCFQFQGGPLFTPLAGHRPFSFDSTCTQDPDDAYSPFKVRIDSSCFCSLPNDRSTTVLIALIPRFQQQYMPFRNATASQLSIARPSIPLGSALLAVRDASNSSTMSNSMIDLLIVLMVLVFVSLLLVGALYIVRKIRRSRAIARQTLPLHNEPKKSGNRRLTITTTPYGRKSSIYVYDEKSSMMNSPASPPLSPDNVPEIRITFPDEQDESGRRKSGRVVIVRVGDTSVGLEPLPEEEQLPAYEKESGERFHSIDMDRIGGLKEKNEYS